MSQDNLGNDRPPSPQPYWSATSLRSKLGLWPPDMVQHFFVPLVNLRPNEVIYDVGCGYSPLGNAFLPYLLPDGWVLGLDSDEELVHQANNWSEERGLASHLSFAQANAYDLGEVTTSPADLVMCQQLLVNLTDPVIALQEMMHLTKRSGRILCVENVNYGAYVARPDLSWRSNLRLSQTWQTLVIAGKWGVDYASTGYGANLPRVFQELGLRGVQWRVVSPGTQPKPPYSDDYKTYVRDVLPGENQRLARLLRESWGPASGLPEEEVEFFIAQTYESDHDFVAVEEDRPITQWFHPFMAIVGWLWRPPSPPPAESVNVEVQVDL